MADQTDRHHFVAVTNEVVIARAKVKECLRMDKRIYFPESAVRMDLLKDSGRKYAIPEKGTFVYYDVTADDKIIKGGAWKFVDGNWSTTWTKDFTRLNGFFSFWRGIRVR